MSFLIACILIYHFSLSWLWYVAALVLFGLKIVMWRQSIGELKDRICAFEYKFQTRWTDLSGPFEALHEELRRIRSRLP